MADRQSEATSSIVGSDDTIVPEIIACLETLSVDAHFSSPTENKRVLRRRVSKFASTEVNKRRCTLKPKKRTFSEVDTEENIKDYYLDKNVKQKPNNLETIYEENDNGNENSIHMSSKRYKRMIHFQEHPTVAKLKKRRAKIQKVFGSKIGYKKKHTSMQSLLDKLNIIRSNLQAKMDDEVK